jgi:predicted DNA-binding transcriptional regulator AlpA
MSALLDADEIARRLGVSRATAYREMRNMVHVVVGTRALRVSELAFDAYVRRRTQDPKRAGLAKSSTTVQPIRVVHPRTKPPAGLPEPILVRK